MEENKIESGIVPSCKDVEITDEVKSAFLDYAMSVIISRAIPDVRDGLKPVNRRIIYAMSEANYTPDKPFVKSARITGDTMGKYHPHGNASIYSALVRMAQKFSLRYNLIEGHGNFGNMDGDGAAAERYTEARLQKLSLELVKDLNYQTVDFIPNYDGSLDEPSVLPARFPNLLVNGSEGIAVGMATKMPPHNLNEIVDGIIAYNKNPDITVEELMKYVKGPDFPTGGIVFGLSGIRDAYKTGRGSFKIRARTEIIHESNGKSKIIVTELPYETNKADIVKNIGELYRNKHLEGLTSIKDFSKENVHIEIELKKEVNPEVILNKLFALTKLQTSYGIINLTIVNGEPRVLSLKELFANYLDFQVEIVKRRTEFLLHKDEARKHIVEGLIICRDNIDEIVKLVKSSENREDFIQRAIASEFHFSEEQAIAIFNLPLGRLTHLEAEKLINEKFELEKNIERYHHILLSRENMLEVVIEELEQIKKKFGDERRTEISTTMIDLEDEDFIEKEDIVITLTSKGYIKRMPVQEFKAQKRGGVGKKGMTTYEDDEVKMITHANTHTDLLMFSNLGKIYRKRGYEIEVGSRISKGKPVYNLLNLSEGEEIVSIIPTDEYESKYLFFATKKGIVKRVRLEEFIRINSNGKIALKFKEDDNLLDVKVTDGSSYILLATKEGRLARFLEDEIRVMGRTAAGVRGVRVEGDNEVISLATSLEGDLVFVVSKNGLGKLTPMTEYRTCHRGGKGVITIKVTEKTGPLCAMKAVKGDEDSLLMSSKGIMVRSSLEGVRNCGRNSQGVYLMKFKDENDYVISCTILPKEENDEEIEEESSDNENIEEQGEE